MSRSNGPFHAPTGSTDPGLAKPVVSLMLVFAMGLACVGLILMVGHPVQPTTDELSRTSVATEIVTPPSADNNPQTTATTTSTPKATIQPNVSPSGTSPIPGDNETNPSPIPPTRLDAEPGIGAPPPPSSRLPSTLPPPDGPVPWDQAYQYMGQVVTVKGTIVNTNNIGNICFLNFDSNWRDKFYIAMFSEAFDLLPDPPQDHYLNKTLLVTGTVTLHHDRPQIEVHDVNQIEVVE